MRLPSGRLAARPASLLAGIAAAVALYSAWHSGGHVWRGLNDGYKTYAAYSTVRRMHAPIDRVGLPSDVFDFYAEHLHRGDRIYYQVPKIPFGNYLDLPGIVAATGDFYLLPAVEANGYPDATVIISFQADPKLLHLQFYRQYQYGSRPIYVSRLQS